MTGDIPPAAQVLRIVGGYQATQAVSVAAKLGLADLVAAGVTTPDRLASTTGTDPEALRRLLRALAGLGLLEPDPAGGYQLTPSGECLRNDHPSSVRQLAIMSGEEHYRVWSELGHSIHTGEAAAAQVLGQPVFAYLATHPDAATTFNRAMADLVRNLHIPTLSGFDFSGSTTLVDIGGGTGSLLRHLLQENPHVKGILFDQPQVIADAVPELRKGVLAGRCQLVGGDFFQSVPGGADTYLMSIVVHDFDDDQATRLLGNVRAAMPPHGRLILLEPLMPEHGVPGVRTLSDLNMLVMHGGRERTAAELEQVLATAGFQVDRTTSSGPLDIIVAS